MSTVEEQNQRKGEHFRMGRVGCVFMLWIRKKTLKSMKFDPHKYMDYFLGD